MMKSKLKGLSSLILCSILTLCLILTAYAQTPDFNKTATLTACFRSENYTGSNDCVRLYYIAEISENYTFVRVEPFKNYPTVDMNDLDSEGARSCAYTLAGYIAAKNIPPTAEARTDESGNAVFNNLKLGVYLVVFENVPQGGNEENPPVYSAQPVLIALPNVEEGSDSLIYDVTVNAKPSISQTLRRVMKIWENDSEQSRPQNVKIQLYSKKAGDMQGLYQPFGEPVVLSRENGWQYIWQALPTGCLWQVQELDVPRGYTVSAVPQGTTVTFTNTFTKPPQEPPHSDTPPDGGEDIPVTGTTWYLVPFLVCFGLIFLIIGVLVSRKEEAWDET